MKPVVVLIFTRPQAFERPVIMIKYIKSVFSLMEDLNRIT